MTPKSNNGGPHENACKPKSTATTAHAEAPACPRPEPTLALASSLAFSTSCLAFSTSCLAFSTFFSASLTSCLSTLASSLRPALSSSSHNAVRVLTACCAVSSSLMATFCTCRAAARSCQVQGCFLVLLPPCHSLQWSRSGSTHQQHARRPSWHLRPSLWSAQRQPAPSFRCKIQNTRNGQTNLALSSSSSLSEGSEACAVQEMTLTPHHNLQLRTSNSPLRLSPQWPTTSKTSKQQHPRRHSLLGIFNRVSSLC